LEYRALHQQIKDEGLYQCRYSEYGKECIRYAAFFGAFLYLLHIQWYMSSAVMLGVFWVCLIAFWTVYYANAQAATDHVRGP
jgi:delta8-fatty-acid desaturase